MKIDGSCIFCKQFCVMVDGSEVRVTSYVGESSMVNELHSMVDFPCLVDMVVSVDEG